VIFMSHENRTPLTQVEEVERIRKLVSCPMAEFMSQEELMKMSYAHSKDGDLAAHQQERLIFQEATSLREEHRNDLVEVSEKLAQELYKREEMYAKNFEKLKQATEKQLLGEGNDSSSITAPTEELEHWQAEINKKEAELKNNNDAITQLSGDSPPEREKYSKIGEGFEKIEPPVPVYTAAADLLSEIERAKLNKDKTINPKELIKEEWSKLAKESKKNRLALEGAKEFQPKIAPPPENATELDKHLYKAMKTDAEDRVEASTAALKGSAAKMKEFFKCFPDFSKLEKKLEPQPPSQKTKVEDQVFEALKAVKVAQTALIAAKKEFATHEYETPRDAFAAQQVVAEKKLIYDKAKNNRSYTAVQSTCHLRTSETLSNVTGKDLLENPLMIYDNILIELKDRHLRETEGRMSTKEEEGLKKMAEIQKRKVLTDIAKCVSTLDNALNETDKPKYELFSASSKIWKYEDKYSLPRTPTERVKSREPKKGLGARALDWVKNIRPGTTSTHRPPRGRQAQQDGFGL